MIYNITVTQKEDYLWKGNAEVLEDDVVILTGETTIGCETEAEAEEYMEKVFLPDLRANFPRLIGDLVFEWEVVEDEFIDPTEGTD